MLKQFSSNRFGGNTATANTCVEYTYGMLANPDIQPSAAINRWIAAIQLFNFRLVHIPAAPRASLSRHEPILGEDDNEHDLEEWVDDCLARVYGSTHGTSSAVTEL